MSQAQSVRMLEILHNFGVALTLAGAITIGLYATWLFVYRLRTGEKPAKSFFAWLKHMFEAVMGL